MHIVCGCLNVKVELENFLDLEMLTLDLSPEEKCHPYFSENVYKVTGNINNIKEVHPHLVKSEIVGSWNIRQCVICRKYTHATNYVTGLLTCSSSLKEEPADVKTFGRNKNKSYSHVFQVCFPCHLDISEEFLSSLPECDIVDADSMQKITKQADSFLEMAEKKMKSNPKICRERQDNILDALKNRLKSEERYLHMLILKSKNDLNQENVTSNVSKSSHLQFLPNYCSTESDRFNQYGDANEGASANWNYQSTHDSTDSGSKYGARSLSLAFASEYLQEELARLQLNSLSEISDNHASVERSSLVDTEGIFEMDDMPPTSKVSASYRDDEDDYDDESEDENNLVFTEDEIHCVTRNLAKSVPLDVPLWPCAVDRKEKGPDKKRPKDPQEIAASMRELARSVRTSSVDVFGELPRSNLPHKPEFVP